MSWSKKLTRYFIVHLSTHVISSVSIAFLLRASPSPQWGHRLNRHNSSHSPYIYGDLSAILIAGLSPTTHGVSVPYGPLASLPTWCLSATRTTGLSPHMVIPVPYGALASLSPHMVKLVPYWPLASLPPHMVSQCHTDHWPLSPHGNPSAIRTASLSPHMVSQCHTDHWPLSPHGDPSAIRAASLSPHMVSQCHTERWPLSHHTWRSQCNADHWTTAWAYHAQHRTDMNSCWYMTYGDSLTNCHMVIQRYVDSSRPFQHMVISVIQNHIVHHDNPFKNPNDLSATPTASHSLSAFGDFLSCSCSHFTPTMLTANPHMVFCW